MALLYGMHADTDPAATVARVGGNATRIFTPGVIAPRDLVKETTAKCGPTWDAGQTAVWSFKPEPGAVASGAWRAPVEALGVFLRANPAKKTVVVIWHEPENDVPQFFADAAAFVRMFDTVAGWLRGTCPNAVVAHAALGYRYADGVDITDATAGKWRTSADLHCLDIYSGRSNPLATILPELSGYRRWRQFVAQKSPWGITERGWTISGKSAGPGASALRAATMAREATWLHAQAELPEVYLLWSTGGTEGDKGLLLDAGGEQVARAITTQYASVAAARSAIGAGITATAVAAGTPAGTAPAPVTREVTCPLCAGSGKYRFTV